MIMRNKRGIWNLRNVFVCVKVILLFDKMFLYVDGVLICFKLWLYFDCNGIISYRFLIYIKVIYVIICVNFE